MTIAVPAGPRLLVEAVLAPAQGTRFQPTGFPDIGAATYQLYDGTRMLLVESQQSVANRLEAAACDPVSGKLVPLLEGLSYVQVVDTDGRPLTTSLVEAHRLNSAYIEKSDGMQKLSDELGASKDKPFDRPAFVRWLAKYDVNCLLHGVFLESIAGSLRLARALSGFVEARDVETVAGGGVKNDRVSPGKETGTAAEGFGNVPFHREEYTAREVVAYFNLDLAQLRGYGLGPNAEVLLYALAAWKVRVFLEEGLRLRTACDLECRELRVTRPDGFMMPDRASLEAALPDLIAACTKDGVFAHPPVTMLTFGKVAKPAKKTVGADT